MIEYSAMIVLFISSLDEVLVLPEWELVLSEAPFTEAPNIMAKASFRGMSYVRLDVCNEFLIWLFYDISNEYFPNYIQWGLNVII